MSTYKILSVTVQKLSLSNSLCFRLCPGFDFALRRTKNLAEKQKHINHTVYKQKISRFIKFSKF